MPSTNIWGKPMANDYNGPKEGRGALFTNTRKKPGTRQADMEGELVLLNGQVVKLAAWVYETKRGKLISLAEKRPMDASQKKQYPVEVAGIDAGDVPW